MCFTVSYLKVGLKKYDFPPLEGFGSAKPKQSMLAGWSASKVHPGQSSPPNALLLFSWYLNKSFRGLYVCLLFSSFLLPYIVVTSGKKKQSYLGQGQRNIKEWEQRNMEIQISGLNFLVQQSQCLKIFFLNIISIL